MCDTEKSEQSENEAKYAISDHSHLYKNSSKLLHSQADRRNEFLNDVKKRRSNVLDEVRGINEIFKNDDTEEPMDVVVHQRHQRNFNYSRRIMLSEWFADIPADLEENWYFKLCPVGIRNLVVAQNGITTVFNRHNQIKAQFVSNLPGGGTIYNGRISILDCIFHHKFSTYYILDLLVWNSCSLLNCSAEFRFYFLKSKLEENPELKSDSGKFHFTAVNYLPAELPLIEQELSHHPHLINSRDVQIDGVLFYHKEADYSPGLTPLVGWLKPYMVPEMLHIPIHSDYMKKKPQTYVSLVHYLERVNSNKGRRKIFTDEAQMDADVLEPEDLKETNLMEN